MALTAAEEARLQAAENAITALAKMIRGAGSKNQLNRLLVLAQDQTRALSTRLTTLETKIETLLTLARKLQ